MQTIPRSYIRNYSNSISNISDKARESLTAALMQLDYSRPVAETRDTVIAIMQVACGASTDLAARLAAEFYDGLRLAMVGEKLGAAAVSMRNPDATDGAIRAFIQIIVDGGDTDAFIDQCASRLDYETRRASKECVVHNAKNDPLKPKWARVPDGVETCAYCLLLASRGFTYDSEETASHTHENCRCEIAPGWGDAAIVSDYKSELDNYKDLFDQARALLKDPDKPEELRLRIASAKNKHLADVKAGTKHTKWTELNELTICARWLNPELH